MKNQKVYCTRNYDQFKVLNGNRDVKNIKSILNSVDKVGQLQIPIVVNENMEVIDGQHRIEAFKQLDLPIYYIILPNAGISEAVSLNNGQRRWGTKDYLHSYVELGNSNYIYMADLLKKHKKTSVQEIIGISRKDIFTGGGAYTRPFVEGKVVFNEDQKEMLERTLDDIDELDSVISSIGGMRRLLVTTISWCLNYSKTDRNRLIKCIKEKSVCIRPAAEKYALLRDISEIYNRNIKAASRRIYFEVAYKEEQHKKIKEG